MRPQNDRRLQSDPPHRAGASRPSTRWCDRIFRRAGR